MDPKKQDPKDPDVDPYKDTDPGKFPGNPTPEDVKNLQKVVSEKDRLLKQAEAELAELKKGGDDQKSQIEKVISGFKAQIEELTGKITAVQAEKTRAELIKTYPDIAPDLLLGKNAEETKKIVEEQRALSKKLYGDSQFFRQPTYPDGAAVDNEIAAVKKNPKLTTIKKLEKIRQLKFQRNKF